MSFIEVTSYVFETVGKKTLLNIDCILSVRPNPEDPSMSTEIAMTAGIDHFVSESYEEVKRLIVASTYSGSECCVINRLDDGLEDKG